MARNGLRRKIINSLARVVDSFNEIANYYEGVRECATLPRHVARLCHLLKISEQIFLDIKPGRVGPPPTSLARAFLFTWP